MEHIFKDLNAESIARLINPPRLQISLRDMLRDSGFQKELADKRPAIAVTTTSKPVLGELQFVGGEYVLHCQAGLLGLRNRQLLVIMFQCAGQEFFVQAQTLHVYNQKVELGVISTRFYERHLVQATCNLWLVPPHVAKEFSTGMRMIRRHFGDFDEATQTHFIIRDRLRPDETGPEVLIPFDGIRSGQVIEISQGGCSIRLHANSQSIVSTNLVYIDVSLRWGKRVGNISSFLYLRKVSDNSGQHVLHCSFLDPLPEIKADLGDASRHISISFGGRVAAMVNGRLYETNDHLLIKVPMGMQWIDARWLDDGRTLSERIFLGQNSPGYISFDRKIARIPKASG